MNLYLTFNGKLIDSERINPSRRRDQEYLENIKNSLKDRHTEMPADAKVEFYLDPLQEEDLFIIPRNDDSTVRQATK